MTDYTITSELGEYAQTGVDVLTKKGFKVAAVKGTYIITGIVAAAKYLLDAYNTAQDEQADDFGTVALTTAIRWWRK